MQRAVELSCNHEAHEFFVVFALCEERGEYDRSNRDWESGEGKNKIAQGWKQVNNDKNESI